MRELKGRKAEINYVSRIELEREISRRTGYYRINIKDILDELEMYLHDKLAEATEDKPVEIRLFNGLTFGSKFVKERVTRNPKSGENIVSKSRLKPSCVFGSTFKRIINGELKSQLAIKKEAELKEEDEQNADD